MTAATIPAYAAMLATYNRPAMLLDYSDADDFASAFFAHEDIEDDFDAASAAAVAYYQSAVADLCVDIVDAVPEGGMAFVSTDSVLIYATEKDFDADIDSRLAVERRSIPSSAYEPLVERLIECGINYETA